jgi:hypothetical protein
MRSVINYAIVAALLAGTARAADLAILRNGNSIRHERRQINGAITRLYLGLSDTGYIEIPTDQIARFEKDTSPPPVAVFPKAQSTSPVQAPQHSSAAAAITSADLNLVVDGAGQRHQIDPDFINSVIRAESGFHSNAVSKKGAQGLMQLMPGTASQLGVTNPFDPNANVEGGTKYLRELLERYNFDPVKALAAYNAGAKRVDKYKGVPPYYETQAYIARIIRDYNRQKIAENPALGRKTKVPAKSSARSRALAAKAVAQQPTPQKMRPQITNTADRATSLPQQASR